MSTSDISRDISRDLRALLADMSPAECRRAWKGALRSAASIVRRAAVAGARSAIRHNGAKAARTIKAEVRRDNMGFAVRAIPNRKHPKAGVHINRWGKAKPVVMWADTGVSKARHPGWKENLPARHFMDAAASAEMGKAIATVRATVEQRAARIVEKRIRNSYGR